MSPALTDLLLNQLLSGRETEAVVFYTSPIACVIITAILAFHCCSALLKSAYARLFTYLNIFLHLVLIGVLLFIGAELSELCVLFMGSTLIYVAVSYFAPVSLTNIDESRGEDEK